MLCRGCCYLSGWNRIPGCRWYEGDEGDEEDVFHPSRGNVLFCAAADGWGFTVPQFARIYSAKFGFSDSALARALWGPYTLQMKPSKGASKAEVPTSSSEEKYKEQGKERGKGPVIVSLSKASATALPMFAQLVLAPLWAAYDAVDPWNDGPAILQKIVSSQGLQVPSKMVQKAGRAGVQVRGPIFFEPSLVAFWGIGVQPEA